PMRAFIDKVRSIAKEVAAERGDFVLFALVEREGSGGRWDLVVSASWFGEDKHPALDYLVGKVRAVLSTDELLSLSRIVLLDPKEEFVRSPLANATEEGTDQLRDVDFQGMFMLRVYLLAVHPDGPSVEENP